MTPLADHGENSYPGSGKLKGKVAVITGGDSGIGRAVAIALANALGWTSFCIILAVGVAAVRNLPFLAALRHRR